MTAQRVQVYATLTVAEAREQVARWTPEERALYRAALEAQALTEAVAASTPATTPGREPAPELLTAKQVSQRISLGENRVYELHHCGRLPAVTRGRRLLWPSDIVDDYLRQESAEVAGMVAIAGRRRAGSAS